MFSFFSWWCELNLLNVWKPPLCTLTIGKNWVDEDDWWEWGWLERTARRLGTSKRLCQPCHHWKLQTRKWAGLSLHGGSWEGVKSISRRTTYHGASLPGFWVDGNRYELFQFLVYQISSLQVVDNVIISARSTAGPFHHSSQLLFMITPFKQLWSRGSGTRSCHRH